MEREYTHMPLGQEVESISGHYVADEELRILIGAREVLCILGAAVWDKSCCGPGGCRYALIPGYIIDYQARVNGDGVPVSVVEPIDDKAARLEIRKMIEKRAFVQQVNFW